MIGKASQSQIQPSALGATLQSSTYGQVIPVIIGRAKSALSLIWAANLRKTGGAGKKGKGLKSKKGKSAPQYAQNADFLLGSNPILNVLQFWENQNQKYPLNFVRYSTGLYDTGRTHSIPDAQFYSVIGVTVSESYNFTVNDYGGPGPVTLSGTWEVPCWNTAFNGPDPTGPSPFRYFPYCFYWTPAMGNTIRAELGTLLSANIYYAQLWPGGAAAYGKKQMGTAVPAAALRLTFESVLGDGPEFSGNDSTTHQPLNQQQILYPMYAGLGSDHLDMGSSTGIPDIRPEVQGAYGMYATGDAEFADMLEDIVKQGLAQAGAAVEYALDAGGNIVTGAGGSLSTPPFTKIQRGIGAFDFPGSIQKKHVNSVEAFTMQGPIYYDQGLTAGNILVVVATSGAFGGSTLLISDGAGHTWTKVFPDGLGYQAWYATALETTAPNPVTVTPLGYNASLTILEIAGVDTFDSLVLGSNGTASITTTQDGGNACYLLAISPYGNVNAPLYPKTPFWQNIVANPPNWTGNVAHQLLQSRVVYYPGTYTLQQLTDSYHPFSGFALLAFKATQPSPYPRALGNLLDEDSLDLTRRQCRAFGLYGSLVMNSQQKASDWMETLLKAMNAEAVFSGFRLKILPKSEQSYAGNGMLYTAPTASGPVYRLTASDFVDQPGESPITCERSARTDVPNILQIQCSNRDSDYYDVVVSEPENGSIALYAPRKDAPQTFPMIQDAAVARKILSVQVRERNYKLNTYKFTLNAKFKLLDQKDLITIPDPDTLLNTDSFGNDISIPMQITSIEEDENYQLQCEAEPFIYGCCAPLELPVTSVETAGAQTGRSPGTVNPPVLFEPPPRLCAQANQGELWAVVSEAFVPAPTAAPVPTVTTGTMTPGDYFVTVTYVNANGAESLPAPESAAVTIPAGGGGVNVPSPAASAYATKYNVYISQAGVPGYETLQTTSPVALGTDYTQTANPSGSTPPPVNNYGGCLVYLSTDGGNSYNPVGQINESAVTGTVAGDWPAAADPDTTNDLLLDLTECGGELTSYAMSDEDNFVYPCYVAGGSGSIPYELMSYANATLTAPYQYTLEATGAGNHLRRAVFGVPTPGSGADHPAGSRFAFLNPAGSGIFKITMDPLWIGKTLYFKFLPVNTFGGGSPDLSDVPAWPYTPTGIAQQQNPNANTYVNTPAVALSRTNATTIAMSAVSVQFPSNTVHYNARTFTIPTPSVPTAYYVTVADPGYLGDQGASASLTATCQTSNALVGTPGNIYMGFLKVSPNGVASDIAGPGGWPAPFTAIVGN